MVTKILDNLFLGDLEDAKEFEGEIICVLENLPESEPANAIWIPIVKLKQVYDEEKWSHSIIEFAIPQQLDLISDKIKELIKNNKVLVHCGAGQERSPLAIMWFLRKSNLTTNIEEAYKFVKKKRPQIFNRLEWLNNSDDIEDYGKNIRG